MSEFRSKEPLISDIYFLAYGSGLLYKVADLATEDEFTDPIVGLGIGVAVFNSLDLNLTYNAPLRSENDFFDNVNRDSIIALSFDIKITDYLAAIGKKRK